MISFLSRLVTKAHLRNQYPNASALINNLPASLKVCFKAEAHVIIEKFLSLKKQKFRVIWCEHFEYWNVKTDCLSKL